MDILFALVAHSEGTFVDAAQSSPSVPELIGFAVDVTDRELTFESALNFIYLIRALFNRNVLAGGFLGATLERVPPQWLEIGSIRGSPMMLVPHQAICN